MIRLAAGLGWFWFVRGFGTEGIAWLERARAPRSAVAGTDSRGCPELGQRAHAAAGRTMPPPPSWPRSASASCARAATNRPVWPWPCSARGEPRATAATATRELRCWRRRWRWPERLDHPLFIGAILDCLAEFAFLEGDLERATTLVTEALDAAAPPSTPVGDVLLARLARRDRVGARPICPPPAPTTASRWRSPRRSATPHFSAPAWPPSARSPPTGARRSRRRDCWERRKRCTRSPEPGPSSPPAVSIARRSTRPARRWARTRSPRRGPRGRRLSREQATAEALALADELTADAGS